MVCFFNGSFSSADSQLSFYRKPAQGVAKKKEQLVSQLGDKDDEKADLEAQMRELDKQLQQQFGPNGSKPKTEAEVKAYMKEVAGRATTCKNYKSMDDAYRLIHPRFIVWFHGFPVADRIQVCCKTFATSAPCWSAPSLCSNRVILISRNILKSSSARKVCSNHIFDDFFKTTRRRSCM
jgi:hypothetical protein